MNVPDQVNEAKIREEICHALDPQAMDVVQVHVKITKNNGFQSLEALQGFLKAWEVIKRQGRKVKTKEWGTDAPDDDLAYHHVQPTEACGLDHCPLGRSCDTKPTPPCAPPVMDGRAAYHITQ